LARTIGVAWQADGVLHLSQRRSAIVRHPVTGAERWFNDVEFFSQWSLDAQERQVLLTAFGDRGLPFNSRFGGGGAISEVVAAVLGGYSAVLRRMPWQAGDLLLVDKYRCRGEFSASVPKCLRDHGFRSGMPGFCRSDFVCRSVFREKWPRSAENAPMNENAPTRFGYLGHRFMIPERFLRRRRKLSVVIGRPAVTCRPCSSCTARKT